jgi:hypothetical protein
MADDQVPKPGSDEAIDQGCTCPVLDNAHGAGYLGLGRGWWIAGGCPLHDDQS